MRNDLLVVTTQGIRGGQHHSTKHGSTRLSVSKGFNEPTNEISVDCFQGIGSSYGPRETALINITFEDGSFWSGDFAKLKNELQPCKK